MLLQPQAMPRADVSSVVSIIGQFGNYIGDPFKSSEFTSEGTPPPPPSYGGPHLSQIWNTVSSRSDALAQDVCIVRY